MIKRLHRGGQTWYRVDVRGAPLKLGTTPHEGLKKLLFLVGWPGSANREPLGERYQISIGERTYVDFYDHHWALNCARMVRIKLGEPIEDIVEID